MSAVAEVPLNPLPPPASPNWLQRLSALDRAQRMRLGVGAALGSRWALREELDAGRLVQLVPEWQASPLPIWLIYPPARFYPARLRRFIDIMRVAVPQAYGVVAPPAR